MLAIETERGRQSVALQSRAAELFVQEYPHLEVRFTPADQPVVVDALIFRREQLCAVAEIKCRELTERQLSAWGGEWLVTYRKLVDANEFAASHYVPLYGLLYLAPEDVLLCVRLTDRDGQIVTPFRVGLTQTQATVNGGLAVRANAFIPMASAKRIVGRAR